MRWEDMSYIHSGDAIKGKYNGIESELNTTDYLEYKWRKYFKHEPSNFQIRYLSRQQGKTEALLVEALMRIAGIMPGERDIYAIIRSGREALKGYMKHIHFIVDHHMVDDLSEQFREALVFDGTTVKYVSPSDTVLGSIRFKSLLDINSLRGIPFHDIFENNKIIFMDW